MKFVVIIFLFFIFVLSFDNLLANEKIENQPNTSYVVIDYNSDSIVTSYRANERMYPASLTKLMTLYILFEALTDKKFTGDSKIKISQNASKQPPTKLGLKPGSSITVIDAILAMIVRSSNDIAYAVAEHVAGNSNTFVKLMNQKAQELELYNTHFTNSTGLPDVDQYTTALDMAKLSKALMTHYSSYYLLFSLPSITWGTYDYSSTNHLLDYKGVDGIKTGYTRASGFNLVTSAQRDDLRVIAVTMGAETSELRNAKMKEILDLSFVSTDIHRRESVYYMSKPSTLNANQSQQLVYDSNEEETLTLASNNIPNLALKDNISFLKNFTGSKVYILKEIKRESYFKKNSNVRYKVQIGAFSSQNAAMLQAKSVMQNKQLISVLSKNNIVIHKKSDFYLSRIVASSKNNAIKACNIIKQSGLDCMVTL